MRFGPSVYIMMHLLFAYLYLSCKLHFRGSGLAVLVARIRFGFFRDWNVWRCYDSLADWALFTWTRTYLDLRISKISRVVLDVTLCTLKSPVIAMAKGQS